MYLVLVLFFELFNCLKCWRSGTYYITFFDMVCKAMLCENAILLCYWMLYYVIWTPPLPPDGTEFVRRPHGTEPPRFSITNHCPTDGDLRRQLLRNSLLPPWSLGKTELKIYNPINKRFGLQTQPKRFAA